ncbi:MAG: xylulose kinase, partial [Chloroflexota bacterium]
MTHCGAIPAEIGRARSWGRGAMELVLGIDCSTTACKAIAWDPEGAPVAEGRAPLELLVPRPGWGEQDADAWWRATQHAVKCVVNAVEARRIAAICITHQRETFVPVDAQGTPLRNAILWLDERSRPQLAELDRRFGHAAIHRITGRPPSLTQSFPKLLWVVEHEPEIAAAAAKFLDVHAFLVHRLTGEWVTSLASADPMGIVDMVRGRWATDLIEGIGLRAEQFVDLAQQGTILGRISELAAAVTGLLPGTPVVAGAGDGQAACLGAGVVGPGRAYVNLGTAIAGGCLTTRYVTDLAYRTDIGAIPGTYVLESVLRGGTATVTWFMEHFADPRLGPGAFAHYEAAAA